MRRVLACCALLGFSLAWATSALAHPDYRLPRWGAEKGVRLYLWDGEKARDVRCKGIWADGAHRVKGTWYFTHFWCEALFSDGWSTFKLHATGHNDFETSHWRCGRLGKPCGGGEDSGGGAEATVVHSCGFYLGVRLTVEGDVSCSEARTVYYTYAVTGADPGWQCSGSAASGRCFGGFAVGDKIIRWSR